MKELNEHLGTLSPEDFKVEPVSSKCPVCTGELAERPRLAHSFIASNGEMLTYFYRTHKDCWNKLSEAEQKDIQDSFVDALPPKE